MSDNAEEGIARAQAAADRATGGAGGEAQRRGIATLDERIMVLAVVFLAIVLSITWATAESALIRYAAFGAMLIAVILWGVLRVRRLQAQRADRERVAREWNSDKT